MASVRSTSPPKSACPGVSTMLICTPSQRTVVFFARMVMPRSRSRALESSTRSATCSLARKTPVWCSMPSTSVVLPWSTWAMMATLRTSGRRRDMETCMVTVAAGSVKGAAGSSGTQKPGAEPGEVLLILARAEAVAPRVLDAHEAKPPGEAAAGIDRRQHSLRLVGARDRDERVLDTIHHQERRVHQPSRVRYGLLCPEPCGVGRVEIEGTAIHAHARVAQEAEVVAAGGDGDRDREPGLRGDRLERDEPVRR